MNEPSSDLSARTLPPWLSETADVLWARRRLVIVAAVVTALVGIVVAMVAPSLLPPRAIVGAAVGLAAVLLAAAIGLAVDAADLVVRGGRHIRAAGADVAASVGRDVNDVGPLIARVALKADGTRARVALVPASRDAGAPGARASALAEALAKTGRRVLVTDLTRPATPTAGLSEVIAGDSRLADVARLDDDLYLARVPVGMDPARSIDGFADWVQHLPSDLEVLIVALPPLADPGVISAASVADLVLIQVEADRTERVDLIAALDAVDAAGLAADVVLVDPAKSWAPRAETAEAEAETPDEADRTAEEGHDAATADESDQGEIALAPDAVDEAPDDLEALAALASLETDPGLDTDPLGLEPIGEGEAAGSTAGASLGAAGGTAVAGAAAGRHPRDLAHVWEESDDEPSPDEALDQEPREAAAVGDDAPDAASPDEDVEDGAEEPAAVEEPDDVEESAALVTGGVAAALDDERADRQAVAASPDPGAAVSTDEQQTVEVVREEDDMSVDVTTAGEQGDRPARSTSDEIDELAREAVRTTAALYALAEEVWRREDGR